MRIDGFFALIQGPLSGSTPAGLMKAPAGPSGPVFCGIWNFDSIWD